MEELEGAVHRLEVATHQKTQQGLKPGVAHTTPTPGTVATHQKTQQGLKR